MIIWLCFGGICALFGYIIGRVRGRKCGEAQGIWLARNQVAKLGEYFRPKNDELAEYHGALIQEIRAVLWRAGKTADVNSASLVIRLWNWFVLRKLR
jgi:hypothetical protein